MRAKRRHSIALAFVLVICSALTLLHPDATMAWNMALHKSHQDSARPATHQRASIARRVAAASTARSIEEENDLESLIESSPATFVSLLYNILQGDSRRGDYMLARDAVASRSEPDTFLLQCLDALVNGPATLVVAPAHLARLVGMLHGMRPANLDLKSDADASSSRRLALVSAVDLARTSPNATLRVLKGWSVQEDDASPHQLELLLQLQERLDDEGSQEAAITLLENFPAAAIRTYGATADAKVTELAAADQPGLAVRVARLFGLKDREAKLRFAVNKAKVFDAIERGQFVKAVQVAGRKKQLQHLCIERLLDEGIIGLAEERCRAWGVPLKPSESTLRLQAARRSHYLELPRDLDVQMVKAEAHLAAVFSTLREARVVGLDTESQHNGGVVLLQLSTSSHSFLLDLVELGSCLALGALMSALLADESVTKLAFGGTNDLSMLAKLPGLRACSTAQKASYIDLQSVGAELRASHQGMSVRDGLSLSKLAEDTIGKPLDKSMVASDWKGRPLTKAQMSYAAMDAWVLVEIYRRLYQQSDSRS